MRLIIIAATFALAIFAGPVPEPEPIYKSNGLSVGSGLSVDSKRNAAPALGPPPFRVDSVEWSKRNPKPFDRGSHPGESESSVGLKRAMAHHPRSPALNRGTPYPGNEKSRTATLITMERGGGRTQARGAGRTEARNLRNEGQPHGLKHKGSRDVEEVDVEARAVSNGSRDAEAEPTVRPQKPSGGGGGADRRANEGRDAELGTTRTGADSISATSVTDGMSAFSPGAANLDPVPQHNTTDLQAGSITDTATRCLMGLSSICNFSFS
ncbi:hypothetical protein BU23DRAFT_647157 [Bimuria novae-zelandiae CBS 107.79]|uniref:Uncharacterized protein n=1 Tax=Bimuria novae-zelandiae CBS 107.79 TaxID=1447943 RepID=A0A6A5VSQ9_9PLEO|nr:hypothetical protein BU23DRAFT_647157 [Bimuria novae-zelandiae CBS 107.79]